jgi:hypothetical protein
MSDDTSLRVSIVRVRALSLRAIERAGGKVGFWQYRWCLEPLLADHVVPCDPMPDDAATGQAASSSRGRSGPVIGRGRDDAAAERS